MGFSSPSPSPLRRLFTYTISVSFPKFEVIIVPHLGNSHPTGMSVWVTTKTWCEDVIKDGIWLGRESRKRVVAWPWLGSS